MSSRLRKCVFPAEMCLPQKGQVFPAIKHVFPSQKHVFFTAKYLLKGVLSICLVYKQNLQKTQIQPSSQHTSQRVSLGQKAPEKRNKETKVH